MTNESGGVAQREWTLPVFATNAGLEPLSVPGGGLERGPPGRCNEPMAARLWVSVLSSGFRIT